ncbi:unnamed protein product [Euphydryas editha]|uniref:Uncharacterized protein n=1 Tax=Euphydryas editha TaxID=104508 RepID=A0AAU9UYP3_EUPED|nr:unnamed protein product [Euphydryas editha]
MIIDLHQNHGGFKITTTGRTLKNGVQSIVNNKHLEDENIQYRKDEFKKKYIKEKKKRKHITLKIKENCRIISTDTTQDRPCCCEVNDKLDESSAVCQGRMDNIVTEIVTPIILKEADAQGLCHQAYKYSSRKNETCQQRVPDSHSNLGILTDERYKVPCQLRSTQICDSGNMLLNENTKNITFKTCECDAQKIMELFDKKAKEMLSKACNVSHDHLLENSGVQKQIHREKPNFSKAQCENCGIANNNEKIMSNTNKLCEKKGNSLCPCQQQKQPFSTEYHMEDQHNKNKKCQCKDYLRKNIICECPKEPEPEVDLSEWIDEKQMRKLKSELTQTRSGFKINKPRKKNDIEKSDIDMNFEELLKYIAENLEDESSKYNKDVCSCSENSELKFKNVITHCECPYEELPSQIETEQISEEEPFTGIKFHISGKGSGSKGLDGILCFELLNDLSKQIKI